MTGLANTRRSFIAHLAESETSATGIALTDLSISPRRGIKGARIWDWLSAAGAWPPMRDNTSRIQADGSLIARLSPGEALVLAVQPNGHSTLAHALNELPPAGRENCYPAPRRDSHCWFLIEGMNVPAMFAKLCAIDLSFDRLRRAQSPRQA